MKKFPKNRISFPKTNLGEMPQALILLAFQRLYRFPKTEIGKISMSRDKPILAKIFAPPKSPITEDFRTPIYQ